MPVRAGRGGLGARRRVAGELMLAEGAGAWGALLAGVSDARGAPLLGEGNRELLAEVGLGTDEIETIILHATEVREAAFAALLQASAGTT